MYPVYYKRRNFPAVNKELNTKYRRLSNTGILVASIALLAIGLGTMLVSLYVKQQEIAKDVKKLLTSPVNINKSYLIGHNDARDAKAAKGIKDLLHILKNKHRNWIDVSDSQSGNRIFAGLREFRPALNPSLRELLLENLLKVVNIASQLNMTYFMHGRTILGSYRHHAIIPWDNDVTLLFEEQDKTVLIQELLEANVFFRIGKNVLRITVGNFENKASFFVNAFFFYQNSSDIWISGTFPAQNHDLARDDVTIIKRNIVFPLHLRPFGPLFLPAPHNTLLFLRALGFENYCVSKGSKVPCKLFKNVYAFVHRASEANGVRETLMRGQQLIHSIVVDEPPCAVTRPYSLRLVHDVSKSC